MNIGQATEALKQGKLVYRQAWGENIVAIFMQVPSTINKEIVPKMQSLPQKAKDLFQKTFDSPSDQIDAIYYDNQIAQIQLSNRICAYSPSCEDILADDWKELE